MNRSLFTCLFLLASPLLRCQDIGLSASEKGAIINAGPAGTFTIPIPGLRLSETDYSGEKASVAMEGTDTAVATYPSGTVVRMTVSPADHTIQYTFSNTPAGAWGFAFQTQIPIKFGNGGQFAFGNGALKPFPASVGQQIAGQATATKFQVLDPLGAGFSVTAPMNYQQVQDNRVFNWPVFMWIYNFSFRDHAGKTGFTFQVGPPAAASAGEPGTSGKPAAAPPTEIGLAATDRGAVIDAGSMGKFTWPVPKLRKSETDYEGEKASVSLEGSDTIVATYPSGMELRMVVSSADNSIRHAISNPPAGFWGFQFQMQIPVKFRSGGQFGFGNSGLKPFPESVGAQLAGQATSTAFHLVDPLGAGFSLGVPMDYQQVQDNRVFNWAVFMYIYNYTFKTQAGKNAFTVKVTPYAAPQAAGPRPAGTFLVDRFGQSARKDYSEKVKSEEELKADVAKDKEYLDGLPQGPSLDSYGGLLGSGETYGLKKTGFFHVAKAGDRWVFVTPEGNAFFQLGVCTINQVDDFTKVEGRENTYEWLPAPGDQYSTAWRKESPGVLSFYLLNWIRKYGKPFDPNEWSAQAIDRLRKWGFNSAGAFSKPTPAMAERKFPYAASLPLAWIPGLPPMQGISGLFDPFAPDSAAVIDKTFAAKLPQEVENPLIIGYFLGNEQLFENVPKLVPAQGKKSHSKLRLVEMLKEKYSGDIAKFNEAWEPKTPLATFDEMPDAKLFVTTKAAAKDMQEFYALFLDKYYSTVHDLYKKYDKNHMLIGSRWQPGTANNETLVRTAARYNEVLSLNYYTYGIEKGFLERLYKWSGRPMILSEWHYTSTDQGLAGGREVGTQKDRGLAYRNYIENTATLPFIIGSQWFSYVDQSITGRWFEGFNGEGAGIGLVNVVDRPYREFIDQAKITNDEIYQVVFGKRPPFTFDDLRFANKAGGARKVMAVARTSSPISIDGASDGWPGTPPEPITAKNTTWGTPDETFGASTRFAWDDEFLYVLADIKDRTPQKNQHKGDRLWSGDGIEFFIGAEDLDNPGELLLTDRQVLVSGGPSPAVFFARLDEQPAGAQVAVVPSVAGDGYTIEAAIPWKALGIRPEKGKEILFDIAVDDSEDGLIRARQIMWNGTSRNSTDRGAWGRARLN